MIQLIVITKMKERGIFPLKINDGNGAEQVNNKKHDMISCNITVNTD